MIDPTKPFFVFLRAAAMLRSTKPAVLAAAILVLASSDARADLIFNGDFANNGGTGQLTVNTTLSGWSGFGREGNFGSQTTPPVFVFNAGAAFANGDAFMGNVRFWASPEATAPGNGIFVAADGDSSFAGGISQIISGLTVGQEYILNFNWAGVQQQGWDGATTEQWRVSFGSETQSTSLVSIPNHGFSGWQTATMEFTATSASQLLSFTAIGAPDGLPPWLLINGVSMQAVPEASSVIMMSTGLVAIGVIRRLRKRG